MGFILNKIFGTRNDRYLKSLRPLVKKINALEASMKSLGDDELAPRLAGYRERALNGESLDSLLPEVFALVRETSVRVLGMRHFDVQLLGGITLHQGKISEMKTGEGKTLVATLPVVLNALTGKGVHVVTVNDYLARRDSEWMGRLYKALGLTVGVIVHGISDEERRDAYAADITYGTNNEFGFDYLRDNMKFYEKDLVQRGHNYAIVDEVDSILIDEARTPLIISGASEDSSQLYVQLDKLVAMLVKDQDFTIDEKARTALLTEDGVTRCEKLLGIENLFDPSSITLQHHILQGLRAHHCYQRDVDYIVKDGKVVIVDEFTGRLMEGRRYGDGLHQALEAKEGVKVESENQTLASITFQNYFRMYDKLAGMTGTAQTEAVEFSEIYGLETMTIPTNKPMIREDYPDVVYKSQREKYNAIVEAIKELYAKGQPVLVGTISIEVSELISSMLSKVGIPHTVLNAKHHEQEAQIVAQAGQKGHVTIATNMAGRGTDIVLGEGVRELGGLHILGTERHESRRIDNQLRGRSGRQGDPGSSRFYLSLEDNLMRIFGAERIKALMERFGMEDGEPIEAKLVSKAIENAQKRVEGHNFDIRKTLLDYDNVMSQQREVIYTLRKDIMKTEDPAQTVTDWRDEVLDSVYEPLQEKSGDTFDNRMHALIKLLDVFNASRVRPELAEEYNRHALAAQAAAQAAQNAEAGEGGVPSKPARDDAPVNVPSREEAEAMFGEILEQLKGEAGPVYTDILRYFTLDELDRDWKEHLRNMDYLREGIGLRGYGQRDPKREYQREGFEMFTALLGKIREGALRNLTHIRVQAQPNPDAAEQQPQQA